MRNFFHMCLQVFWCIQEIFLMTIKTVTGALGQKKKETVVGLLIMLVSAVVLGLLALAK